jgi:hypothetical protein
MTIIFFTDEPESTLDEMIQLVDQAPLEGSSTFWYFDATTGFNHTAVQWNRVGSFLATADQADGCIALTYQSGPEVANAVSNSPEYLYAKFVEFLLIYFKSRMREMVIRGD